MNSFIAIGRIHIPAHALVAAAGLMIAMVIGLRTAALLKIDRDAFWDVEVVSILAAFILSRVLLIAADFTSFRQFPIAVLEMPALTPAGLLGALLVAFWYLRRRHLPLLGALDAAAVPAALLWAFFGLADFVDGIREGMPSTVPWAVGSSFGRVHPVELYRTAAWLIAAAGMFWILLHQRRRGETAFSGLMLAGLVFALTDFFRLPAQLYGTQVLDSVQWRGLEMIVGGGLLLAWREAVPERTAADHRTAAADAV